MGAGPKPPPSDNGDPALDLLASARNHVVVGADAKRRIWERVTSASGGQRHLGWLWIPGVAAALAIALVVWSTRRATVSVSHSQDISVPRCGVSRVADSAYPYRAAFVGPAEVALGADHVIRIQTGRALVTAAVVPVDVEAVGSRVTVEPDSFVEVTVSHYKSLYVAAHSGTAQVTTISTGTTVRLATGEVWVNGAAASATSADAAAARTLADEAQSLPVLCAAPDGKADTQVMPPAPASPVIHPPMDTRVRRPAQGHDEARVGELEALRPMQRTSETPQSSEASQLAEAIQQLRQRRDPHRALTILDGLDHKNARREFQQEAALVRLEALQLLGDVPRSLQVLDGLDLPNVPRGHDLLLLRADLRAKANRCREAVDDYSLILTQRPIAEAPLVGRASCRFVLGEQAAARADLELYLAEFPDGRHAVEARRGLGRQP